MSINDQAAIITSLQRRIASLERAASQPPPPWVSFTPSWTNVTVGNGTNTGNYRYVPGGIWVAVRLLFGSTTTIDSSAQFTLPNSETSANLVATPGFGHFFARENATGKEWGGQGRCAGSGTLVALYAENNNVSSTNPASLTTGDFIEASVFVPL